jgi:divalent metal cation (Fe/Co/Zn/Cd) transporter
MLAWAGNGWHVIEFAVAVAAGVAASSVALIAFGFDSLIELAAGLVILWRLAPSRAHSEQAERRAQRLIAAAYFALAVYIAIDASLTLVRGEHPDPSPLGIALAAAALVTMPALARAKRRVAARLGSASAAAEAGQNMLCAYLSAALLVGLAANALFGAWWADPLAALAIGAVALREGVEVWQGEDDCC